MRNLPNHPAELGVSRLLAAYRVGWFPMADSVGGTIEWFNPNPRAILPLDALRVPRSLMRVVRAGRFEIRHDTAFEDVIRACASPRHRDDESWIDERLVVAYRGLHDCGAAHSVEAWLEGELVGGLYGVHLGAAFMGESMFSRPDAGGTNASKVCLVHLVEHLNARGFELLDTQFRNPHLDQFGCVEIPRIDYLARLALASSKTVAW